MAAVKRSTRTKAQPAPPDAGVSDEAVLRATGKTWKQWVAALNKAGAKTMSHRDIAAMVKATSGLSGWWSQGVTVGYEKLTGRRVEHQRPDGYSASASKTIAAPVQAVFAAWEQAKQRDQWLGAAVSIRKATPHKSMRVTWKDGTTILAIGFYAKGADKAQVALEHPRLKSPAEVKRTQAFWRAELDRLKALLEA